MSDTDCKPGTKPSETKLDPDVLYEEIGGFGRFQLYVYILIFIPLMFCVSCNFSYIFTASDKDIEYRCFIPGCDDINRQYTTPWIRNAIPQNGDKKKCERLAASVNKSDDSDCSARNLNQSQVVSCETFFYSPGEHMLLQEFNLTCDAKHWKLPFEITISKLSFVGSFGYVAECVALPFIGLIADKYGRRPTLIWSIALVSIFGIAKTFMPNYVSFIALHFVGALFGAGAFALIFVFGTEVVGPNNRALGAAIISNAVSAGQMMLAFVAMNNKVTNFRILLRILYGLVAFTLTFIWLIPESVRWLFTVGKYKEGVKILEKVTKLNGTKISPATWNTLTKHMKEDTLLGGKAEPIEEIVQYPLAEALKSKLLLLRLIICCYCYFATIFIYSGLSICSTSLLGSDKYMNLFYAAAAELPGNAATYFVLKSYGRKWSLIISLFACSVACIGWAWANTSMTWILVFIAKFTIALSLTIFNIYSIELFPTNVRQSMFCICMVFLSCGNIFAPLFLMEISEEMKSLPQILFGVASFTSALLVLLFPETRNKPMPDTIDEAINI